MSPDIPRSNIWINNPPATKWSFYFWPRMSGYWQAESTTRGATYCTGSCRSGDQEPGRDLEALKLRPLPILRIAVDLQPPKQGHLFMPWQSCYVFVFTWEDGPDGHQSSGDRPGYQAPASSSGAFLPSAAPLPLMLYGDVISGPLSVSTR